MDKKETFEQIKEKLRQFRDERDWDQYHSPKNLSMAISVEASELMEHFLWDDEEDIKKKLKDKEKFKEVKHELADILNYAFMMADELDVDVTEIMDKKLEKNKEKYPAEKVRGSAKKYSEYD